MPRGPRQGVVRPVRVNDPIERALSGSRHDLPRESAVPNLRTWCFSVEALTHYNIYPPKMTSAHL